MKSTLRLLCVLLCSSLLVACGVPASSVPAAISAPETAPPQVESAPVMDGITEGLLAGVDVGVCIYNFDDSFMTNYRWELERYLMEAGASCSVRDGRNNPDEQMGQVDAFIAEGVDVLLVNAVLASYVDEIADKCHDAGIPVIFMNRGVDEDEAQRWADSGMKAAFVGVDHRNAFVLQADLILSLPDAGDLDGDGVVGYARIVGDPEEPPREPSENTVLQRLEEAGVAVELLGEFRGEWGEERSYEVTKECLAQFGYSIEVVGCSNGEIAIGALQAIEEAGRKFGEDIYLIGMNATEGELNAILEGRMSGTVYRNVLEEARTVVNLAAAFIAGETVDVLYEVDYVAITAENAAACMEWQGFA